MSQSCSGNLKTSQTRKCVGGKGANADKEQHLPPYSKPPVGCTPQKRLGLTSCARKLEKQAEKKYSAAGIRTRVARVRAEYPRPTRLQRSSQSNNFMFELWMTPIFVHAHDTPPADL
eukprot:357252-Chlamydomonas_euryale.AAC.6